MQLILQKLNRYLGGHDFDLGIQIEQVQRICREWAYSMPFQNSEERSRWLPRYLSNYNRLRKHSAIGHRSPQQRLYELLA